MAGPKILLEGQRDYVKYFPPNATSASIPVEVHTTSPLISFTVTSVSRGASDLVFPTFVSNSPYDVVWRHSIRVTTLTHRANGVYEIEVFNREMELATQRFTIHKANGGSLVHYTQG